MRGRLGPPLAAAIAASVAVRVLVAWGRYDGLYGQDPFAYLDAAEGLRSFLAEGAPLRAMPFPVGYPLLLALAALPAGGLPWLGAAVSLGASVVAAVAVAGVAWEACSRRSRVVPLVAGSLCAFNGQLWRMSLSVMADATAVAAMSAAAWLVMVHARRGRGALVLALAAAASAYGVTCRWALALAVPAIAAVGLRTLARLGGRRAIREGVAAAGGVLLVALPAVSIAVAAPRHGFAPGPAFTAPLLRHLAWSPAAAFRRQVVTPDGVQRRAVPNAVFYAAAPAHGSYFGPLLALSILPGLPAAWRSPGRGLLLGWLALACGFLAGDAYQSPRFTLTYLPPLAVVAAMGADAVAERLGRRTGAALLLAGFLWAGVGAARYLDALVRIKERHLDVVRWVDLETEPDAEVIAFGLTETVRRYGARETFDLYVLQPGDVARLVASPRPTYLLADLDNLRDQWRGMSPEANLRLLERSGLDPVGCRERHTLLRVASPSLHSGDPRHERGSR